ncbi:MAG: fumarate/nitrate reduction transcriptional regulator Fnr [Uliginosibacterium sp.]|nr:fumarate/nitrate reduction transcriptional regulator Fnr [Uliginosibacterium sp.]MBK9615514.1 fumarate/nitrate reduction transcriptional regulator Fnr [Uliginosibacterium sp.]
MLVNRQGKLTAVDQKYPIPLTSSNIRAACAQCSLRELCLAVGLDNEDLHKLDDFVIRRKIKRGQQIFRAGDPFEALYAIRIGFFKTDILTEEGLEQVTGFHMAGEIIGMDGISNDYHVCNATALEDSEICIMPYDQLEELSRHIKSLQQQFHKFMSREIVRDQSLMILLGSMRAEERIAAFLLNLSQRMRVRGYSASEFHLRMTREEIGSYLGLKLETVSRAFSKFHDEGLIGVQQKYIRILNAEGLKALLNHAPS